MKLLGVTSGVYFYLRRLQPVQQLKIAITVALMFGMCAASRCRLDEIEFTEGKNFTCLPCENRECYPGTELSPPCGSVVRKGTKVNCIPCKSDKYSENPDFEHCKPCRNCAEENKDVTKICVPTHNAICGNCSSGFYMDKKEKKCFCCSYCCENDKDDIKNECLKMPRNLQCAVHNQQGKCDEQLENGCPVNSPENPNSNDILDWQIAVMVTAGGMLILIIAIYCYLSRNCGQGSGQGSNQYQNVRYRRNESCDNPTLSGNNNARSTAQNPAERKVIQNNIQGTTAQDSDSHPEKEKELILANQQAHGHETEHQIDYDNPTLSEDNNARSTAQNPGTDTNSQHQFDLIRPHLLGET